MNGCLGSRRVNAFAWREQCLLTELESLLQVALLWVFQPVG